MLCLYLIVIPILTCNVVKDSSLHFHYFVAIFYFLVIIFDGKGGEKDGDKEHDKSEHYCDAHRRPEEH